MYRRRATIPCLCKTKWFSFRKKNHVIFRFTSDLVSRLSTNFCNLWSSKAITLIFSMDLYCYIRIKSRIFNKMVESASYTHMLLSKLKFNTARCIGYLALDVFTFSYARIMLKESNWHTHWKRDTWVTLSSPLALSHPSPTSSTGSPAHGLAPSSNLDRSQFEQAIPANKASTLCVDRNNKDI
jgi:hypothetical protein